jgi:hypothetical protein
MEQRKISPGISLSHLPVIIMSELLQKTLDAVHILPKLELIGGLAVLAVSTFVIARAGVTLSDVLRDVVQGPRAQIYIKKVLSIPTICWSLVVPDDWTAFHPSD